MPRMTGGEAVVRALAAEGVEVVFGLPGVQIMHIYDAFYNNPDIRVISCRHEQTTAYMADGYARSTGKVGVALVVPGPGAYNAAAGMSDAYATSSPVLLISGQIESNEIGKDFGQLHEITDQLEFMKPVVKWNDLVTRAEEIPETIHEAMRQMKTGRPRPVEVEIPPDTLGTVADIDLVEPEAYIRPAPDPAVIEAAAKLIASAERPLIWAGGGVNLADAGAELTRLAELLQAPVINTSEGKGAIPETHPLSMGTTAYSWGPGAEMFPQADVVLSVGSRLGSYRPEPGTTPRSDQKLINLNIDETEFGKTMPVEIGIAADAKIGLSRLIAALQGRSIRNEWDRERLAGDQGKDIEQGQRSRTQAGGPGGRHKESGARGRLPDRRYYQHRRLELPGIPRSQGAHLHHVVVHGEPGVRLSHRAGGEGRQPGQSGGGVDGGRRFRLCHGRPGHGGAVWNQRGNSGLQQRRVRGIIPGPAPAVRRAAGGH